MKKICVLFLFMFLAACNHAGTDVNQAEKGQSPVQVFACEDNSQVSVSYSEDGETAYVQLTMPELKLENEAIELKLAVSASGSRYVNDSDPEMKYDWHTKAKEGVMRVTFGEGKEYSTVCVMR